MSHVETTSAVNVIESFKADLEKAKIEHAELIAQFKAILPTGDALNDFHMDLIDGLKDTLGADAANQESDSDAQDEAISDCEEWVSANLASNPGETAALCIAMYGTREGSDRLYSLVHPAPRPSAG